MLGKKHEHSELDFSHLKIVYVGSDLGSVQLEFCGVCGQPMNVLCEHKKNTWNNEETKLICDLCGVDGT